MDKKLKDLKTGLRLNMRKPPKIEVPKNVYSRKLKHKKGDYRDERNPLFYVCITCPVN